MEMKGSLDCTHICQAYTDNCCFCMCILIPRPCLKGVRKIGLFLKFITNSGIDVDTVHLALHTVVSN